MSIEKDYTVYQGSDFAILFTFKDAAGVPLDLTNYTFAGQIRRKTQDATVIGSFVFTKANQGTNPGEVTASIAAAVSSAIVLDPSKNYIKEITHFAYDMERTRTADGNILRFREGTLSVSPEVTR